MDINDIPPALNRRALLQGVAGVAAALNLPGLGAQALAAGAPYDYPKKYLWKVPMPANIGTMYDVTRAQGKPEFDVERLMNSPLGAQMADNMENFIKGYDPMDPRLVAFYAHLEKGLKKEMFGTGKERWACYTPLSMHRPGGKGRRYPVMFILHGGDGPMEFEEGNGFLKLAARDEVIVVVPQNQEVDNVLHILDTVKGRYAADAGRVYAMGYSNGGTHVNLATFARPDLFAAAAPSPRPFPLASKPDENLSRAMMTPEVIERYRHYDLPVISVGGMTEYNYYYPITADFPEHGGPAKRSPTAVSSTLKIELLRHRLHMMHCRVPDAEEFRAQATSSDIVKRKQAVPFDHTSVLTLSGVNHYIGNFINESGKNHFRMIAVDNMPHFLIPNTAELIWAFVKRFSREQTTGRLIEQS